MEAPQEHCYHCGRYKGDGQAPCPHVDCPSQDLFTLTGPSVKPTTSTTMEQVQIRLYIGLHDCKGLPLDPRTIEHAKRTIGRVWECATLFDAQGLYNGDKEPCLVVEYIGTENDIRAARGLAITLAGELNQECVALSVQVLQSFDLITRNGHTL